MKSIKTYHEETKHHFSRYARSLGYLDWANQPHPFRFYKNTETVSLRRIFTDKENAYETLYSGMQTSEPLNLDTISRLFRYSMGLSAWKEFQGSRWALRVNPSSGNLHPTEAYMIAPPIAGLDRRPGIWHYRPDDHVLENRAGMPQNIFDELVPSDNYGNRCFLVGLSSIVWREAWKYGERAFRYCQHDIGHAIAALRFSASLLGWNMNLLSGWSDESISLLLGLHRTDDFIPDERELPEMLAVVYPADAQMPEVKEPSAEIISHLHRIDWRGTANRLSNRHEPWPIIDDAIAASEKDSVAIPLNQEQSIARISSTPTKPSGVSAESILLQRRSAQAFDPDGSMNRAAFTRMMRRAMPDDGSPWDSLWWPPQISLLVFVHRVEHITPGMYMLIRNPEHENRLREVCSEDFVWEREKLSGDIPFNLLQPGDARAAATAVSCRQDIAGDGFFSLGMIADFEKGLKKYGNWFYRRLFWESGVIGQVLYLEAEANRCRGTGIGCYFDDAVHQLMGLPDTEWQSLYHFTVGDPITDTRLTTTPGYPEESHSG